MAEALAQHLGPGVIEPSSAGLYPAPIIQPETIQVMAERGIRLEPRPPRSLLLIDPKEYKLLVNMSGGPISSLLSGFTGREILWQVRDPIGQDIKVYRAVRDQIERKVVELIHKLIAP